MKKYIRPITITIFSVLFAFSLQAQDTVKLIAPVFSNVKQGETLTVPIKVESFTNVSGMQFTLRWNPDVLEFMHVDTLDFGLDFLSNDNFGKNDSDKGILTFFWEDITTLGKDLSDSSTIFKFYTKVIGDADTAIEFSDDPTGIELSAPDFTVYITELVNGSIQNTTGSYDLAIENARINITPNPFVEKTNLSFNLEKSSPTQIQIFDLKGGKIYEESDLRSAGTYNLQLDKSIFPAVGIYLLKINTEDFQATEKLFLVR